MKSPVKIWRNQKHIVELIGKTGTIACWTIIRIPPAGFADQAPYPVVLVALESGERFTCQLTDWKPEQLHVGQKVRMVVRKIMQPTSDDIIPYGIKAKAYDKDQ